MMPLAEFLILLSQWMVRHLWFVSTENLFIGEFSGLYIHLLYSNSCVIVSYPLSNKAQLNPSEIGQIDPHILELDILEIMIPGITQRYKIVRADWEVNNQYHHINYVYNGDNIHNSNSASSNSISGLSLSLSLDGTTYHPVRKFR